MDVRYHLITEDYDFIMNLKMHSGGGGPLQSNANLSAKNEQRLCTVIYVPQSTQRGEKNTT